MFPVPRRFYYAPPPPACPMYSHPPQYVHSPHSISIPYQPPLQYHYIQPPHPPQYPSHFQSIAPIHRIHHYQPPPPPHPQLRSIEIRSPNSLPTEPLQQRMTTPNTVVDGVNTLTGEILTHEPPNDTESSSSNNQDIGVVTLRDLLRNSQISQCTEEQSCEQCSICQTNFEGQILRTLPCNHCFHALCIDEWFCTNNTCPLCRVPLTTWAPTDDSII